MKTIKVQCPAKINLNLKVLNRRNDGFHNIESIMQTISLYDYITISTIDSTTNEIFLSGTSSDIPYDKSNLVYKAAILYLDSLKGKPQKITIHIEKNIPISAGLAGGSTDAAGTIFGLNEIMGNKLSENKINDICAQLGSDLNFCLNGGCMMTSGRGEIVAPRPFKEFKVNLIKPKHLGISAKEAYTKFANKITKTDNNRENFINDLEWAIFEDYPELQYIKSKYPSAVMTGSGSTYFSLEERFLEEENYLVINDLKTTSFGVKAY